MNFDLFIKIFLTLIIIVMSVVFMGFVIYVEKRRNELEKIIDTLHK